MSPSYVYDVVFTFTYRIRNFRAEFLQPQGGTHNQNGGDGQMPRRGIARRLFAPPHCQENKLQIRPRGGVILSHRVIRCLVQFGGYSAIRRVYGTRQSHLPYSLCLPFPDLSQYVSFNSGNKVETLKNLSQVFGDKLLGISVG